EHPPPLLGRGLLGGGNERDAGIVDEHVDPSELLPDTAPQLRDVRVRGNVARHVQDLGVELPNRGDGGRALLDVGERERVSGFRERFCDAATDSLGGARDDRHSRRRAHAGSLRRARAGLRLRSFEPRMWRRRRMGCVIGPNWKTTTALKARKNGQTGPPTATESSTSHARCAGSASCLVSSWPHCY